MKEFLLVFVGGGLGSVARFGLSRLVTPLIFTNFPVATLVVNALASLVLGFFLAYLQLKNTPDHALKFLIAVGFCGGFSTFSTFSHETLVLLRSGESVLALGNIVLSVGICLVAVWGGFLLARYWL